MSEVIGFSIRQRLFQIDLLIFQQKIKKCFSIMHIFVLLLRNSSEIIMLFTLLLVKRRLLTEPWDCGLGTTTQHIWAFFSGLLWMSQCALDDYSLSFFALLFVHFYWLFSVVVIVFQTLRAWQKNYISWLHQKRNSFIGKRFGGKKWSDHFSDQSENTYIVNILWWQYQKHA